MKQKQKYNWLALALICISFIVFTFIVYEVLLLKRISFDESVAAFCSDIYNPVAANIFIFFTALGSRLFLLIAYAVVAVWLLIKKQTAMALRFIITGVTGYFLLQVLKIFFHRTRPLGPLLPPLETYSFPSGHTTTSCIFLGLLIYLIRAQTTLKSSYKTLLTAVCVCTGILIGLSRIYLREHFATDVIGGFCIAVFYLIVATTLLERWKYFKSKP